MITKIRVKLPLQEKDTRSMTHAERQAYVVSQLKAMGVKLEQGNGEVDGEFAEIITPPVVRKPVTIA